MLLICTRAVRHRLRPDVQVQLPTTRADTDDDNRASSRDENIGMQDRDHHLSCLVVRQPCCCADARARHTTPYLLQQFHPLHQLGAFQLEAVQPTFQIVDGPPVLLSLMPLTLPVPLICASTLAWALTSAPCACACRRLPSATGQV